MDERIRDYDIRDNVVKELEDEDLSIEGRENILCGLFHECIDCIPNEPYIYFDGQWFPTGVLEAYTINEEEKK